MSLHPTFGRNIQILDTLMSVCGNQETKDDIKKIDSREYRQVEWVNQIFFKKQNNTHVFHWLKICGEIDMKAAFLRQVSAKLLQQSVNPFFFIKTPKHTTCHTSVTAEVALSDLRSPGCSTESHWSPRITRSAWMPTPTGWPSQKSLTKMRDVSPSQQKTPPARPHARLCWTWRRLCRHSHHQARWCDQPEQSPLTCQTPWWLLPLRPLLHRVWACPCQEASLNERCEWLDAVFFFSLSSFLFFSGSDYWRCGW